MRWRLGRAAALEARLALRILSFALPRMPFPAVCRAVLATEMPAQSKGDPQMLGAVVERMGSRLLGARSCLPEALAGVAMLRRHGHRAELVIGVAAGPVFEAHAWVEVQGLGVVGAKEATRFRELWRGR